MRSGEYPLGKSSNLLLYMCKHTGPLTSQIPKQFQAPEVSENSDTNQLTGYVVA